MQTLENYNAQKVEMVEELELKQDENHGIVKLRLKTLVEIEAQHHLPFLPVPFHALFFLFVAEGRTINTKEESPSESQHKRSRTTINHNHEDLHLRLMNDYF